MKDIDEARPFAKRGGRDGRIGQGDGWKEDEKRKGQRNKKKNFNWLCYLHGS